VSKRTIDKKMSASDKDGLIPDLSWPPGTHPIHQAHLWTPEPLYEWQREGLVAAARPHSRAIISAPNESGKTGVMIPVFGFSCMARFPGCSVYSTSKSDRQVKLQLFAKHLVPMATKLKRFGWTVNKSDLIITAPNGSTWMCYVCSDADNVEGFHGKWIFDGENGKPVYKPLIYTIDEAKGVRDDIEQGVRRIDPDFELVVSTPGKAQGFFFDAFEDIAF